jgi:FkbM family methyltransferase
MACCVADSPPLKNAARPWASDTGGGKTIAVDSFFATRLVLPHKARSFADLPGPGQTPALLAEIATAPCPFAPAGTEKPLALYGAGNLGHLARDHLKAVGHDFVMALDRNAQELSQDPRWRGVRVIQPEAVSAGEKRSLRLAVSVVTAPYVPIERALSKLGFTDIVPFYDLAESFRHLHPLSNGWFAPPLTAQERENTEKVLALWHDDVSRAHHLQFLAWRRLREEWTFDAAPPTENRFFIPEVTDALHGDEILLDGGAHHGDVTEAFVRKTNGSFRQIVAVEPDPSNRTRLKHGLQRGLPHDARMTIQDCALAADSGEALFHDGLGYASQLADTGRIRIVTRPLDALALAPTFVKLHLEGGELAALQGARQTLLTHRPIVAATVYHNADGIWRTPLWLMQTLADYRFLFRLHSWCGTGAVVYALPRERGAPRSRP